MTITVPPWAAILFSLWFIVLNYSEAKLGFIDLYHDLFGEEVSMTPWTQIQGLSLVAR